MREKFLFLFLTPLILGSVLVGFMTGRAIHARESSTYWNESVAERVRNLVGTEYVDEISDERGKELFYAAMEAYLSALDPYCAFYDPVERRVMETDTSGQFGGVGILVRKIDGSIEITGIRRGDPADVAGVRIGDKLVKVENTPLEGLELQAVTPLIRGRPGDPITMEFLRGTEKLAFRMLRSEIKVDSVVGVEILDRERGVGYLRVTSFQENSGEHAMEALVWLKANGARSFILYLRQNTGGILEKGAVALVDLFLTDGPIVQTRGRSPDSKRVYRARDEGTVCPTEPLIVLVDGGSASAAEVAAGAFQDRRRAVLVGERTYGKFLVQSIHRLPDLDVALQFTTARYYTPYGRWLQRDDVKGVRGGLVPDVVVPREREATEYMVRDLMPNQHGQDMIVAASASPNPGKDPQIARALRLLADYETISEDK